MGHDKITHNVHEMNITLFHFKDGPDNPPERFDATLAYDPADPNNVPQQGDLKVTIAVGDHVVCGTVTLPLDLLNIGMQSVMQQYTQSAAKKHSGLVGFDKPPIITKN